jgi:FG-GAP-like repeat
VTGDQEATGNLGVTGTAAEGGTLTASLTNVVDADGATTTSYRWQELVGSTWTNIAGQTNAILNIASDQSMVGKQVRVIATTLDPKGGTTEFLGAGQMIANVDDPATGTLSVTGIPNLGTNLTASLTNVVDPDGTIASTAYRWQEFKNGSWADIAGSTSAVFAISNDPTLLGQLRRVVVTTTDSRGGTTSFTSSAYTIGDPNPPRKNIVDFNGDGNADLLWRNNVTGQNVIWYLNKNKFAGNSGPSASLNDPNYTWREGIDYDLLAPIADTSWKVVGQADFNGDGKTDVLWRNIVTGVNVVWYLDGKNFVGTGRNVLDSSLVKGRDFDVLFRVADVSWKIEGVGDFNGDGKTDVLWHNGSSGTSIIWYLKGNNFIETVTSFVQGVDFDQLVTVGTNWKIEAVGDFNGDQKADIVWRNYQTGVNFIWYTQPTGFFIGNTATPKVAGVDFDFLETVEGPNWNIELATDINRDGKADIVWRNYATGDNFVWYLNGKNFVSGNSFAQSVQGQDFDFFFKLPGNSWELSDVN